MRNPITPALVAASALALAGWCWVGLTPNRGAGAPPEPPAAGKAPGEEKPSVSAS
jgi:hypothetical protein